MNNPSSPQTPRPSFDEMALLTALLWSRRSPDPKTQVGACILDEHHRVIGVGYNGRAPGEDNNRESMEHGLSGYIHAEENALIHANWNGNNHTIYVTHEPCSHCARLIIGTHRVTRVVYLKEFDEPARIERSLPRGSQILEAVGIQAQRWEGSLP